MNCMTKSLVDISMVTSKDGLHTYEITREFKNDKKQTGKTGIFVGSFPTMTKKDINTVDSTTMHILNHLEELGFNKLIIVNLLSKVCSNSRPLSKDISIDTNNFIHITDVLLKNPDGTIILGFGNSFQTNKVYSDCKMEFVGMCKELKRDMYYITIDGALLNPCSHPLFLGIRHKNKPWKLARIKNINEIR